MANILIVDDNERNRNVLNKMIQALGHTPILAENGVMALAQIKKHPPDLVLLDILMPKMDGYEVLNRIKENSSLRHIPVIMITAVDDTESAALCIAKGADDYLPKPLNPTLLNARISSCLEKKRLQDQEKEYSHRLEEEVRQKTVELSEAHNRLKILDKAKSDLLDLISHELRTPLSGILGAAEILFRDDTDDATRNEFKEMFDISKKKLLAILDGALLLTQIEISGKSFPLKPILIHTVLKFAVESATDFARSRQVLIGEVPDCDVQVLCDQELLVKALAALLETSVKFSCKGNTVSLSCELMENEICVEIRAHGRAIPDEAIPRFFEVFSIVEPITPGGELGLGPPVAERIIRLFNGSVAVENQDPPGICITVRLKRIKSEKLRVKNE